MLQFLSEIKFRQATFALLMGLFAVGSSALTFLPRMDHAQWISRSHILHCTLIQPIPDFGRATFEYLAGDKLHFYLEATDNPFDPGQATLTSKASTWYPQQAEEAMGLVKVSAGKMPVIADKQLATYLLAELYKGKSPTFLRKAWYVEEEPVEVAMSAARFRDAYASYRDCIKELLPVGFDQIERSKIHFELDKWDLDEKATQWLDILAQYLTTATDIERFYIDGHTDATHSSSYNLRLSRSRADTVRDYLVAKGVSPNLLAVRYHGERYPIATNNSAAGRAKNRRVTLRVELSPEAVKTLAKR